MTDLSAESLPGAENVADTHDPEKMPLPERGPGDRILLLAGLFALALAMVLVLSARGTTKPMETAAPPSHTSTPASLAGAPASVLEAAPAATENPAERYALKVNWGELGPRLVAAGAIDLDRFIQLYADSGRPLDEAQIRILAEGSDGAIVFDPHFAHFSLNLFWALGLVNENPILTEGPLVQYSEGNVGRFASTGGWTLGSRPATELYASAQLITLAPDQQERLEEVAMNVYRPCCNNHTAFADCNHGMAMLGLLELMAGNDATVEEMFATAKAVNSFWFPQQALETAVFFKAAMNLEYADVDPRMAVGPEVFSGSGFQQVHQWLAENNLLAQPSNGGNSCGV
jgi:hypothetical protein